MTFTVKSKNDLQIFTSWVSLLHIYHLDSGNLVTDLFLRVVAPAFN